MDLTRQGIYKLVHLDKPGYCYIGSTSKSFSFRLNSHLGELKRGKHCCKFLQHVVNKYGISGLRLQVLESSSLESSQLRELEQKYIDEFVFNSGRDKLLNSTTTTRCTTDDPEVMQRQRLAARANGNSSENLARIKSYNEDVQLREKRIEALKLAKCRKVLCVELGIVFESCAEAGKFIVSSEIKCTPSWQNVASTIAKCLKGKCKAYRLTWLPVDT